MIYLLKIFYFGGTKMWFQKKKQEEAANRRLMEQMSENLDKLQKRNEEISKQQQTDTGVMDRLEKAVSSMGEQLEVLKDGQKEQERLISCQSDSFQGLLEQTQRQQEEKEYYIREVQDFQQKEQIMLAVIVCCREQMGLLRQQIAKDNSIEEDKKKEWEKQFEIMNRETTRFMRPCGLEEVGIVGEEVNYDIHEILSVIETESEEEANTVAEVYSQGLLSGGHVIKKAKVVVYQLLTT